MGGSNDSIWSEERMGARCLSPLDGNGECSLARVEIEEPRESSAPKCLKKGHWPSRVTIQSAGSACFALW